MGPMNISPVATLLRDPLAHFLIAGAALFGLVTLLGDESASSNGAIVVTARDTGGLAEAWEQQWQRPPTEAELLGQIRAHVRIEMLYREALAIGLDENDSVIRRRLAQRMQFVLEADSDTGEEDPFAALLRRYDVTIEDERLQELFAESGATADAPR